MILPFIESDNAYRYSFVFDKIMKRKGKEVYSVHSNGVINTVLKKFEKIDKAFEIIFNVEKYNLGGVKEPLIFNPTKWVFDIDNNISYVRSKENLKTIWERYKNKIRNNQNQAHLLVSERLFFHTPNGFENSGFSNGPYLAFFANYYNKDLQQDDLFIHHLDWLSIPSNIPLKITYRPQKITSNHVDLEGWITLNEEVLDDLLTKPAFRDRAMDYHFSKDFNIESKIILSVDIKTSFLNICDFYLEIDGAEGGIHEFMKYRIERIPMPGSGVKQANLMSETSFIISDDDEPDGKTDKKKKRWSLFD